MKPKMKISALILAIMVVSVSTLRISSSKDIEIDTLTSSDHIFVELKQLEYFPKHKKVSFINDMIDKHSEDLFVFKSTESNVDIG